MAVESEDPIITIDDVRKAGHCAKGARRWCENNGFDFREFLKSGLPESVVIKTNDAFGLQVIERKRERERGR